LLGESAQAAVQSQSSSLKCPESNRHYVDWKPP
jgi:hypothetical protein